MTADTAARRLTKNEKRRLKKKEEKVCDGDNVVNGNKTVGTNHDDENADVTSGVQVEYVSVDIARELQAFGEGMLDQFKSIFEKFAKPEDLTTQVAIASSSSNDINGAADGGGDDTLVAADDEPAKLSRRKKKMMTRLSVAELKQLVQRPDVVEAHDVTSSDPRLLVYLKAYRNTVPVPRHWCHKSKYLQRKRGIEKPPFQLPEFIADTGISKIRASVMEQEAMKKGKQKARDRMQPRMGKIDIDYQVLHDAFFKYQTKPKLIGHGDLYYEGKEFEIDMKHHKTGVLSAELLVALGMADRSSVPPPWLINMQRYGPPPSYPNLRIPGLNAPIPTGAGFGYHPGGWGKPPVDEYGRPLYGDVFGVQRDDDADLVAVDRTTRWGEVVEVEAEEEEQEEGEEDEEKEGVEYDAAGAETPMTMDGGASMLSGMETPDTVMDLRKRAGLETPDTTVSRELYQVIQEKAAHGTAGQLFGSDRTYVLPGKGGAQANPDGPSDTGLAGESTEFEEAEAGEGKTKKRRRVDDTSAAKKYKDFKF